MKDEDAILVAEFQRGDQAAFDELVNRYKRRIYDIAYRMTKDQETRIGTSRRKRR